MQRIYGWAIQGLAAIIMALGFLVFAEASEVVRYLREMGQ